MPLFFAIGPLSWRHPKGAEVLGAHELGDDADSVEGGVCAAVVDAAVGVGELHEADVLEAMTLRRCGGHDHPLIEGGVGEGDRVVAGCDPLETLGCPGG